MLSRRGGTGRAAEGGHAERVIGAEPRPHAALRPHVRDGRLEPRPQRPPGRLVEVAEQVADPRGLGVGRRVDQCADERRHAVGLPGVGGPRGGHGVVVPVVPGSAVSSEPLVSELDCEHVLAGAAAAARRPTTTGRCRSRTRRRRAARAARGPRRVRRRAAVDVTAPASTSGRALRSRGLRRSARVGVVGQLAVEVGGLGDVVADLARPCRAGRARPGPDRRAARCVRRAGRPPRGLPGEQRRRPGRRRRPRRLRPARRAPRPRRRSPREVGRDGSA